VKHRKNFLLRKFLIKTFAKCTPTFFAKNRRKRLVIIPDRFLGEIWETFHTNLKLNGSTKNFDIPVWVMSASGPICRYKSFSGTAIPWFLADLMHSN